MNVNDDIPLQRTLRVGRVTIGLLGLDTALHRITDRAEVPLDELTAEVYAAVAKQNYIPPAAADNYRAAIRDEILRLRDGKTGGGGAAVIRILGPGCVSCNSLQKLVIEVMAELGIAADVLQIHDLDEIGRFGVMNTPALVINGQLKCAGRLPRRDQIETWIRESV